MVIRRGLYAATGVLVLSSLASGQYKSPSASGASSKQQKMAMTEHKMMTTEQKIKNAVSAAPASISSKATIKDWPASEGAHPAVLRDGSNGWTCFPDMPHTKGNDPMCLDEPWLAWLDGYISHKTPEIKRVGVGYMIAPGGAWTSNTDPYATKETPDNQWGYDPPHTMIVVPSVDALMGLPNDRTSGGPWVMYPNTPYAHVMVPMSAPGTVRGTR